MKDALLLVFANKQDLAGCTLYLSPKPSAPETCKLTLSQQCGRKKYPRNSSSTRSQRTTSGRLSPAVRQQARASLRAWYVHISAARGITRAYANRHLRPGSPITSRCPLARNRRCKPPFPRSSVDGLRMAILPLHLLFDIPHPPSPFFLLHIPNHPREVLVSLVCFSLPLCTACLSVSLPLYLYCLVCTVLLIPQGSLCSTCVARRIAFWLLFAS